MKILVADDYLDDRFGQPAEHALLMSRILELAWTWQRETPETGSTPPA